jgi:hypothetical protein
MWILGIEHIHFKCDLLSETYKGNGVTQIKLYEFSGRKGFTRISCEFFSD